MAMAVMRSQSMPATAPPVPPTRPAWAGGPRSWCGTF